VVPEIGAFDRHIVLVGFMGAGKSTMGAEVARVTDRRFVDTDAEIERRHGPIDELFARGETEFRQLEEEVVLEALAFPEPSVIAVGGGAVTWAPTRERLRAEIPYWVQVEVDEAWRRVASSGRPLASDPETFRRLFEERRSLYEDVTEVDVYDVEDVLLDALNIEVKAGSIRRLGERSGAEPGSAALIADERLLELHVPELGERLASTHTVASGESAKTLTVVERLWEELRIDRDGTVVGFGGGTTTDLAGFVAATYLRGVRWLSVPTTLLGQVDAGIGGKTGINHGGIKNAVGAFHYPDGVFIDPDVLTTLPDHERRAGMAEVVKTALLAGRELWSKPDEEMVRGCASFKAGICLSDPFDRGSRAILNLGHTFAHALEAASEHSVSHGDAVALGLLAALRLSGLSTDVVDEVLRPKPVRVDRTKAWEALERDKKRVEGRPSLVLLERPGEPRIGVQLPDADVRRALDELIAD
jgi:shikimate kinase/3-dehydroquinate synthase